MSKFWDMNPGLCLAAQFVFNPFCFLLQRRLGISNRNALVQILLQKRPKSAEPLILGDVGQLMHNQAPLAPGV